MSKGEIKQYDLAKPQDLAKMAKVLKHHIVKHKLYVDIGGGKNYVFVEGWQFAGGLLGVVAQVVDVEDISITTAKGRVPRWKATVELRHLASDNIIGKAVAICSADERKKRSDFEVLSMAQTRAVGKAYRLTIGWVMKLAGYEATPAEEMETEPETQEQVSDYERVKKAIAQTKTKKTLQAQKKAIESGKVNLSTDEQKELLAEIDKKLKTKK